MLSNPGLQPRVGPIESQTLMNFWNVLHKNYNLSFAEKKLLYSYYSSELIESDDGNRYILLLNDKETKTLDFERVVSNLANKTLSRQNVVITNSGEQFLEEDGAIYSLYQIPSAVSLDSNKITLSYMGRMFEFLRELHAGSKTILSLFKSLHGYKLESSFERIITDLSYLRKEFTDQSFISMINKFHGFSIDINFFDLVVASFSKLQEQFDPKVLKDEPIAQTASGIVINFYLRVNNFISAGSGATETDLEISLSESPHYGLEVFDYGYLITDIILNDGRHKVADITNLLDSKSIPHFEYIDFMVDYQLMVELYKIVKEHGKSKKPNSKLQYVSKLLNERNLVLWF